MLHFDWKKMKNEKIWILALFVCGLFWIFGSFFVNLSFPDSSYNFPGKTYQVKLDSGKPVTQTFTAKENDLNQIKIVLGNSSLQLGEKIVFELADATCEKTLAQGTYHFYDMSPFIYYHFTFPALSDSLGQTYCFKVTYYSPINRKGDRPYLGASEGEQFLGWSYTNAGNPLIYENRTLQMRPAYGTGSFFGDLEQLNNRLSQYKPGFLKGTGLTLIFSLFFIGTIALVYLLVFKKEEK